MISSLLSKLTMRIAAALAIIALVMSAYIPNFIYLDPGRG